MSRWETLPGGVRAAVSDDHKFQIDGVLLADFSAADKARLACDLCSGCGVVPIRWLDSGFPPRKTFALELQNDAVDLMRRTIAENGWDDGRLIPLCGDLRSLPDSLPKNAFELVSCNPPYTPCGSGRAPDGARLAARQQACCTFPQVCEAARRLLRRGGRFCFCMRPRWLVQSFEDLRLAGLEPKRFQLVQHGSQKPFLALVEAVNGGRCSLDASPVLILNR